MLPGIGVFGTGEITKVLVPILRDKGFNIVAIWERTAKDASEAATELKIPFHTTKIDDVLLRKDVDLIFITCSPYLHSQISVKALGIGKHVMCDKPMSLGQSDGLKMVRASQYYPSLISIVNHSLRFLPAFVQMKKALKECYLGGTVDQISLIDVKVSLGNLYHNKFDWLCDGTMGGGVLNLVGGHVIDLVSFLTEKKAVKVHGVVRTYTQHTETISGIRQITAPDFCCFQMELEGSILVTVNINSNISNNSFFQEVTIYGGNGHLTVRGGDLIGFRLKSDSVKEEKLYLDIQDLHFATSESTLPRPYVKGLCKMITALRDAFHPNNSATSWIKEPVQSAASFEDGLYVQAVLEAIKRSSESKTWMKVSIMKESPQNQKILNMNKLQFEKEKLNFS